MLKILSAIFLFLILVCLSCDNPFLPPTDVPIHIKSSEPRATPSGLIDQLFESYEKQKIELFKDVISKNNFRFYVASGFATTDYSKKYHNLPEKADTFMQFVTVNNLYYYWGYDAEVNSHSNLFSKAEVIKIPDWPISDIHYISDTLGDTIYAEVKVQSFTLEVSRYESTTLVTYTISNQPQVFLLQKDDKKLWVITKWYDLGTEGM